MFSAFFAVVFFVLACGSLIAMIILGLGALLRNLPGNVPRRPVSSRSRERSSNKHGRGYSSSSGGGGSDDDRDSDGDGGSDGGGDGGD